MSAEPDFWLIECDTFWRGVPSAIACSVIAGPGELVWGHHVHSWLVRVTPPVTDHGVTTDRVLIDCHPPDVRDGDHWTSYCVGAYSVDPRTPDFQRTFTLDETVGGHKITVTTRPENPHRRDPRGSP